MKVDVYAFVKDQYNVKGVAVMKECVFARWIAFVVASLMLISLFACNNGNTPGNTETEEGSSDQGETVESNAENNDYSEMYNDPYEVFEELVSRGYEGTFEEWVASLNGEDGKSAYELAVANGYSGTEAEWIASLAGESGKDGKSAYELAVEDGYTGSLEEWLVSLCGEKGDRVTKATKEIRAKTALPPT